MRHDIYRSGKIKNTLISEAKVDGISKRKLNVVKNLLNLKINIDDIIKTTRLYKNEILALKK